MGKYSIVWNILPLIILVMTAPICVTALQIWSPAILVWLVGLCLIMLGTIQMEDERYG